MKSLFITQVLFILQVIVGCISCFAQNNVGNQYVGRQDISNVRFTPSTFDLQKKRVAVSIGNTYVWVGNNILNYGRILDFFQIDSLTEQNKNDYLSELSDRNLIGAGVNVVPISIGFRLGSEQRPINIALTWAAYGGATVQFNQTVMGLLFKGNKSFVNQTVDIGKNFAVNAGVFRDFGITVNMPVWGNMKERGVRLGASIRLVRAVAGVYTELNKLQGQLNPEIWQLNADYKLHTVGFGVNDESGLFSSARGRGFAFDLGATATVNPNIELTASLLDLGAVYFSSGVRSYVRSGPITWEGGAFGALAGGGANFRVDSLEVLLKPDTVNTTKFSMPLANRLVLQGVYKMNPSKELASDLIFLTYIQGFNNVQGNTTRPYISAAYLKQVGNIWGITGQLAYGSYSNFAVGFYTSVALLKQSVRVSLGLNNLLPIFLDSLGNGVDFGLNLTAAF